jgi:hypothetical protein
VVEGVARVKLSAEDRKIVDEVKQAIRTASTPAQKILAYNSVPTGKLHLTMVALRELEDEMTS